MKNGFRSSSAFWYRKVKQTKKPFNKEVGYMRKFPVIVSAVIMAIFSVFMVAPASVHAAPPIVDMTMNVDSGVVVVNTNGIDSSTWHPGAVGQANGFAGVGGFSGTYKVYGGNYGALEAQINAASKPGGADFQFGDTLYFNVLSANHINNVIGDFSAHASGIDGNVAMNLKSVGTMYVWSEATNPYSQPALQGNLIEKGAIVTKNAVPVAQGYLLVSTNGLATIYNSNIWGWGIGETGTLTTNYGGGTRNVSATGSGVYNQAGFGQNYMTYNGFTLPGGGTLTTTGPFNSGLSGVYQIDAH